MDIKDLIPKDKFDNSTIKQLNKLTDKEIKPIIYKLLEWLQDLNWPIAQEILPIIIKHQEVVVPYISSILNGQDIMWKIWVMELIIPALTYENKNMFHEDIKNLSRLVENDEDTVAIIESANKCLQNNFML